MIRDELPEDWSLLAQWLPKDLNALAWQHGFLRRARGLQDAQLWLRLILMHVAGGLSLKQTTVRAAELNLAHVSSVALFKRLRASEAWLRRLTAHLLEEQRRRLDPQNTVWNGPLRVIDATEVVEPGATGSAWRVHYSLRLPELVCDHYEITSSEGGEKLGRFDFKAGELVLVDRGYSHRAGVAKVIESKAHVVVRWNHALFPLLTPEGKPFRILSKARRLKVGEMDECSVCFDYQGQRYSGRICLRRKGRLAAEEALQKALRKAQKNGTKPDPESLELTKYILIFTSLPAQKMKLKEVLELYRCRWQVELQFKRLKSLLAMGHVPKHDDACARAWMQAKILTSLLIERTLIEGRFFSPWGDGR